ncbi:MAG: DNA repair helicase [Nitrosopumilaceae archaeon]
MKDLSLKEEYRSDRDNLIEEFFLPCLDNCIEYDRAVEYVALKSLTAYYFGLKSFVSNNVQIRIVTGHRLRTSDLNVLSKLYSKKTGKNFFKMNGKPEKKFQMLYQMIQHNKLKIKIAMPISEEVYGTFDEKIGIFRDENDDVIAFTGTSNETFDPQNRNFESIDVFTSWNDKSRVEIKTKDFENLWQDETKNLKVYDFEYAVKNNLLIYSPEWAVSLS